MKSGSGKLRRVVIVARDFPPAGGAPAIRITKLVKYLPEFGWQPEVLTVPTDHVWMRDDSLLAELPPGLDVHRVPRLLSRAVAPHATAARAERELRPSWAQWLAGLVLIPDRSILWAINVSRHLPPLLERADALLTSGPPFSTHLVALLAAPRRMPWVADYRDNWTTNPDYRGLYPLRPVHRLLERAVLRRADAVLAMSSAAAEELASVEPSARQKIVVASNGFDPDDLPPPGARSDNRFRLVYAGSMRATRNPGPLLEALSRLIAGDSVFADLVELHLLGAIPESALAQARAAMGADRVHADGFLPHRDALARASEASVLVAISSEAEAGGSAMTSKLFECMALGRPVLYIAPPGPGADLMRRLQAGEVVDPHDVDGMVQAVARLHRRWRDGGEQSVPMDALAPFNRRETGRIVADQLDAAVLRSRRIRGSAPAEADPPSLVRKV